MEDNERKKLLLQALANIKDSNMDKVQQEKFASSHSDTSSKNLAKGDIDKEVLRTKSVSPSHNPDVIKTKTPEKIGSAADMQTKLRLRETFKKAAKEGDVDMMKKLKIIASKMGKGMKMLPIIGSVAALAGSQDASAAIPGLDAADPTGPAIGSLDAKLEAGEASQEEMLEMRKEAIRRMMEQSIKK